MVASRQTLNLPQGHTHKRTNEALLFRRPKLVFICVCVVRIVCHVLCFNWSSERQLRNLVLAKRTPNDSPLPLGMFASLALALMFTFEPVNLINLDFHPQVIVGREHFSAHGPMPYQLAVLSIATSACTKTYQANEGTQHEGCSFQQTWVLERSVGTGSRNSCQLN